MTGPGAQRNNQPGNRKPNTPSAMGAASATLEETNDSGAVTAAQQGQLGRLRKAPQPCKDREVERSSSQGGSSMAMRSQSSYKGSGSTDARKHKGATRHAQDLRLPLLGEQEGTRDTFSAGR